MFQLSKKNLTFYHRIKKVILPVETLMWPNWRFWGRCVHFQRQSVFIDVYIAGDKIATSGATSLADIDLRRTYRAIDSVATGRIPSLFCALIDTVNKPQLWRTNNKTDWKYQKHAVMIGWDWKLLLWLDEISETAVMIGWDTRNCCYDWLK